MIASLRQANLTVRALARALRRSPGSAAQDAPSQAPHDPALLSTA
jgi:hypothetical protein